MLVQPTNALGSAAYYPKGCSTREQKDLFRPTSRNGKPDEGVMLVPV